MADLRQNFHHSCGHHRSLRGAGRLRGRCHVSFHGRQNPTRRTRFDPGYENETSQPARGLLLLEDQQTPFRDVDPLQQAGPIRTWIERPVRVAGPGPSPIVDELGVKTFMPDAVRCVRGDLVLARAPVVIRNVDHDQEDATRLIPSLVRHYAVVVVPMDQLGIDVGST